MAETRKSKRRSSILKSLNNTAMDGRNFERRRVSFNREITVKEFHKLPPVMTATEQPEEGVVEKVTEQSSKATPPTTLSRVYTMGANESFFQMSTPIDKKNRRISGVTMPSRLSIIPSADANKSFVDDSDFEVFEEESSNDVKFSVSEAINIQESKRSEVGLGNEFGRSIQDDFGEVHASNQKGPASNPILAVELPPFDEDLLLLNNEQELEVDRNNDTMSSTIHVPHGNNDNHSIVFTNEMDLSVVGKEGLIGTNELDPLTFPVSLLTPPKPPVDGDPPANHSVNIVKELIAPPTEQVLPVQQPPTINQTIEDSVTDHLTKSMSFTCNTMMGVSLPVDECTKSMENMELDSTIDNSSATTHQISIPQAEVQNMIATHQLQDFIPEPEHQNETASHNISILELGNQKGTATHQVSFLKQDNQNETHQVSVLEPVNQNETATHHISVRDNQNETASYYQRSISEPMLQNEADTHHQVSILEPMNQDEAAACRGHVPRSVSLTDIIEEEDNDMDLTCLDDSKRSLNVSSMMMEGTYTASPQPSPLPKVSYQPLSLSVIKDDAIENITIEDGLLSTKDNNLNVISRNNSVHVPVSTRQESVPVTRDNSISVPASTRQESVPVTTREDCVPVTRDNSISVPVTTRQESVPVATREDRVPVTRDNSISVPASTRQESVPVTTRQESVPVTTREDRVPVTRDNSISVPASTRQESVPVTTREDCVPVTRDNSIFVPASTIEKSVPVTTREDRVPVTRDNSIFVPASTIEKSVPVTSITIPTSTREESVPISTREDSIPVTIDVRVQPAIPSLQSSNNEAIINKEIQDKTTVRQGTTGPTHHNTKLLPPRVNNPPTRNHFTLPVMDSLAGKKRRPILSATAVVSKQLAIGGVSSDKTPQRTSDVSKMKSPYMTRSASAQKSLSVKKSKEAVKHTNTTPSYSLRSSSKKVTRRSNDNKTFTKDNNKAVDESVTINASSCTMMKCDDNQVTRNERVLQSTIMIDKAPEQPHPDDVHSRTHLESPASNKPLLELPGPSNMMEQGQDVMRKSQTFIKAYQEQPKEDNKVSQENPNHDTFVQVEGLAKSMELTGVSVTEQVSPSFRDADWMQESISELLIPVTPTHTTTPTTAQPVTPTAASPNPVQQFPLTPTQTTPINPITLNETTPIPLSSSKCSRKRSKSVGKKPLAKKYSSTKSQPPSPLSINVHVAKHVRAPETTTRVDNPIQAPIVKLTDYPARTITQCPTLPSISSISDFDESLPKSPGIVLLDGTINQTVIADELGFSDITITSDLGGSVSMGQGAMAKLLRAVPQANTTLHLDEEYNQQMMRNQSEDTNGNNISDPGADSVHMQSETHSINDNITTQVNKSHSRSCDNFDSQSDQSAYLTIDSQSHPDAPTNLLTDSQSHSCSLAMADSHPNQSHSHSSANILIPTTISQLNKSETCSPADFEPDSHSFTLSRMNDFNPDRSHFHSTAIVTMANSEPDQSHFHSTGNITMANESHSHSFTNTTRIDSPNQSRSDSILGNMIANSEPNESHSHSFTKSALVDSPNTSHSNSTFNLATTDSQPDQSHSLSFTDPEMVDSPHQSRFNSTSNLAVTDSQPNQSHSHSFAMTDFQPINQSRSNSTANLAIVDSQPNDSHSRSFANLEMIDSPHRSHSNSTANLTIAQPSQSHSHSFATVTTTDSQSHSHSFANLSKTDCKSYQPGSYTVVDSTMTADPQLNQLHSHFVAGSAMADPQNQSHSHSIVDLKINDSHSTNANPHSQSHDVQPNMSHSNSFADLTTVNSQSNQSHTRIPQSCSPGVRPISSQQSVMYPTEGGTSFSIQLSSNNESTILYSPPEGFNSSNSRAGLESCTFEPTIPTNRQQHSFVEYLEILHARFKCINDATRLRMTPGYSNDVDVVELVEFFNTKTTSCMYTLRCVLDYIRLNDVTECICDIEPVEWENLPNLPVDDHDIDVDYLLTKTLWLQVMIKDVMSSLYDVYEIVMEAIERCFGWGVYDWTAKHVVITIGSKVKVLIDLNIEGNNPGQSIQSISYESISPDFNLDTNVMPKSCKTVLEIPVMISSILKCV